MEWLPLTAVAVVAVCLFLVFTIFVKPWKGVVIARFSKPHRSCGSGIHFRIPLVEKIIAVCSTKKRQFYFKIDVEAENNDRVPLDVHGDFYPDTKKLITYLSFTEDGFKSSLEKKIESIVTVVCRNRKNRKAIHDGINDIAEKVKQKFRLKGLEGYFGIKLDNIVIPDPKLPPEIAKAEVEAEKMRELNKARRIEMNEMRNIARKIIREAKKFDQDISFEEAIRRAQIQFGKVKEVNHRYGLNRDTGIMIHDLLKEVLRERK